MAAHAGETAHETGDVRGERCRHRVDVTRGDEIPRCPDCGNDTFAGRREPGSTSS
ncbi:zinc ribbon-containing protein [Salinarimonas rosea]|uniref:zinc ribbon-containing protein n=1 Tax=Salinarimonas rosea TaxID=552063 RepID=UPI00040B4E45|nr:alpha helical protein [Salinarimonas rosea]